MASDLYDVPTSSFARRKPFMPKVNRIGRPREADLRAVVNAILCGIGIYGTAQGNH
jgi:hypothetical protein